ncbi:RING finger protein 212B isoform X3 [Hyla sarda]|uniref:RING finger protein 212B isoform X3 n=1 Tax=Hyla sarda TaxID=327740 RepID=UPI0024C230DD|nr:RING finger protein 212B isoform X3 [Hyla sarda]
MADLNVASFNAKGLNIPSKRAQHFLQQILQHFHKRMDWFHCNVCHTRQETTFYVTSCGHILCKTCITEDYCSVCRTACKYLPISESVWNFQKQQHEHHVTFYKQYITKVQNAYTEALQKIENQENELKAIKKENAELKSIVTNLKLPLDKAYSSVDRLLAIHHLLSLYQVLDITQEQAATDISSYQSQTPNETTSAPARDSFTTQSNNIDRLRAIQLKFTPKLLGSLSLRRQ